MSLYSAMRAGVSGLFSQSQSMAMISDNIANVSTNGYKLVRSSFSSLITIQGTNGAYTAGSVRALPTRSIDVSGSLTATNNPLDLSIIGEGFFAITDRLDPPTGTAGRGQYFTPAGETLFTRDGGFRRDANGNLRNANGHYLLGWPVLGTDSVGNVEFDRTNLPSTLTAVSVQATTGRPQPSKNLTLNANIDSKLLTRAAATIAAGGTPESFSVTMNIYDRQGTLHTLRVRFSPAQTAAGGVGYEITPPGANAPTIEKYAYEVTMAFEGSNTPKFRNGTSTSTPFYAVFDSIGNFKSFYQPVGNYQTVNGINTDGTFTGVAGALANQQYLASNHIPPIVVDRPGFFVEDVQLNPADNSQNETWLDLGVGNSDPAAPPVVANLFAQTSAAGGAERPDLRIIADSARAGALQFNIDSTVAAGGNPPAAALRSYGQAVLFDVDFSGNGTFEFNGNRTVGQPEYGDDVQVRLNFGAAGIQNGLTHYNAPSAITNITQDGFTIGQLEGVQISEEGYVTAVYDNGDRKEIAQVPVVSFNSPNNLEVANGNAFRETQESGSAVVRFPGTSGVGNLAPSTLETSNVDIAEEFTHMIITQRAYSANTKIITTADEMLDELIRAKR